MSGRSVRNDVQPSAAVARRRPVTQALPPRVRAGLPIEWLVVGLTGLAIVMFGTVSAEVLSAAKIHYITAGGAFFEKLHPGTYVTILAFVLLLFRGGDVIGELDRVISGSKLLLVYFFTCGLLAFQCIVLKRPFTNVIDTFLLPALLALIIWNLTPAQRKPLVYCIHFFIWLNIALGFYEYFSKHRLVPMTMGKLVVTTDWRSTALLGYPLAAAGIVAMYILMLALKPRLRAPPPLGVAAFMVAMCSLMVFGGRTALVMVLVVLTGLALFYGARLVRGERYGLTTVIMVACCLMLIATALPLLFGTGVFDNMIGRFSSDKGSAHARIATIQLLSLFDWKEFLLGSEPGRASSLQSMMGLDYGIENFWIACIAQYGLIQTALITLGLACFFAEVVRRSSGGAWIAVLFLVVVAASSVSFSSKTITLAIYVSIICVMLPREPARQRVRAGPPMRPRFAAPTLIPSR
ncbi:VpsF family polysaccharide biosynthesis protein [Pseudolabrys taiwanensis]|uniref:VpsF family polysaccharide biosynthesis protein n=1 Tax=Pseudolabrys taiwanensis TaxID=331696 RepID=UPI001AEC8F21|nr:VpsF family polysaccharide biosynthesis protein [Pseudolabrys taiwanensis]